jgi:hypothetical protein
MKICNSHLSVNLETGLVKLDEQALRNDIFFSLKGEDDDSWKNFVKFICKRGMFCGHDSALTFQKLSVLPGLNGVGTAKATAFSTGTISGDASIESPSPFRNGWGDVIPRLGVRIFEKQAIKDSPHYKCIAPHLKDNVALWFPQKREVYNDDFSKHTAWIDHTDSAIAIRVNPFFPYL